MPLYNFICKDCGAQTEIMASMEEKEAMKSEKFVCKKCGSTNLEYILDFAGYSGGSNNSFSSGEAPSCATGQCPFV